MRKWRYRKVLSIKNHLPGGFKIITLSCERSRETPSPSVGPNRHSAVNIGGTTIHSVLGMKPVSKLLGLSDEMKASSRNRSSEFRMVLIDELSMVSSGLFYQVHARLEEIFLCTVSVPFTGLAVVFWVTFYSCLQSEVSQYMFVLVSMIK